MLFFIDIPSLFILILSIKRDLEETNKLWVFWRLIYHWLRYHIQTWAVLAVINHTFSITTDYWIWNMPLLEEISNIVVIWNKLFHVLWLLSLCNEIILLLLIAILIKKGIRWEATLWIMPIRSYLLN